MNNNFRKHRLRCNFTLLYGIFSWAFVTTALIEGLCAKRTKTLQEFSEQSLIDCDNSNYGCKGGVPPNALK